MSPRLFPGVRVRHRGEPDWGIGQVQSVIGDRVTVNFEHAGKRLINGAVVRLEEVETDSSEENQWRTDDGGNSADR